MLQEDTIAAVATAAGEGGIGIIRISGPRAWQIAAQLFQSAKGKAVSAMTAYQAAYGHIMNPQTGRKIDEALLLLMKAPHSYTCEDIAEIHCHGSAVSLRAILQLALALGARLAEPGEFTKRAFLNGRLDLAQAEAVIDIIRAKTDMSLKMAVDHLSGQLSDTIRTIRQDILRMIAHLEAAIDFPEEDIETITAQEVQQGVGEALHTVNGLLQTAQTGRILREGLQTVIIGKPNVGKSSLLNALLRDNRAIVTEIPGTTRDVIEEYVNIRGIPLKLVDTAGIRETADIVEKIGVERSREYLDKAELILFLLDSSVPMSEEDREILPLLQGRKVLLLINKSDLPAGLDIAEVRAALPTAEPIYIAAATGSGLQELEQGIEDMVYSGGMLAPDNAFITNVRHTHSLTEAAASLVEVDATIRAGMPPDCIVVDLRNAWEKLGEITGDTVNEDIISEIFSQFCIGK